MAYNPQVRVKGEVEELVKEVARKLRYSVFTVRNVAILYGLAQILASGMPESDAEFLELLERVARLAGKTAPVERSERYVRYVRKARKLSIEGG